MVEDLVTAEADTEAQDNHRRTALHWAAAEAQGVFQILLRHRATQLNSRMHCGSTPLMVGIRNGIEVCYSAEAPTAVYTLTFGFVILQFLCLDEIVYFSLFVS